jgi:Tol biopolymer transport system component
MPLTPGARLGPYEVLAPLGAGGMGEVYRARDSRLRRDVALKILPTNVASDPDRRARFEQEAHAAAALNHPNILAIYDVGSVDDTSYIAAELVNGATLATAMERGAMPIRTLLDIAVQIADGLASAHAAHIVHRDLKPANVMITSEGRIKILDFGLAKQTAVAAGGDETIATHHTVPGMIVGTVSYMSPEQACGKPVDHRSDQFSFGLMLYEMAAGKKAFNEPESVQTLAAIVSNEPPPLDARVPAPLRWIIDRCLAKNPEQRYDSSRDLYHELRNIREHLSEISTEAVQPVAAPSVRRRVRWLAPVAFLLGLALPVAVALARLGPPLPDPSAYRFTPFAFEPGGQTAAVFSPDGKAVAYSSRQTFAAPYQVHVRYLDAPTAIQLTDLPTSAHPIGWSPDDKRVLFVTGGESPAVWSIATVGGEPQLSVSLPKSTAGLIAGAVTVSPDNKLAAFLSHADDGTYGVSTVALPAGTPAKYPVEPYATKNIYNAPRLRFSPDGKQLLLIFNRGQNGEEGWLLKIPAEGPAGVRQIEPPFRTLAGTPTAAWMPDSRHVVMSLQATRNGSEQLWMVDTQSAERHALTSGTRSTSVATVAPDGNKLILSQSTGNYDIVSVDVATGGANLLIATERNESMPSWAASEQTMAYISDRNGPDEIWLRQNGVPDRPVVSARDFPPDTTQWFMAPALSPRGDRVTYTRIERDGTARLWISAVAGGTPIRVSRDEERVGEFPGTWSPDGGWLTYYGVRDGKLDLMKANTSGEAVPVFLKGTQGEGRDIPDWSPTGEWILSGNSLISPDGKTVRSLGQHGSAFYTFSKDGKFLYGLRPEKSAQVLFSIDIATGAEHVIGSGNTFPPRSNLSPSIRLSLAPDGKSFIYGTGVIRNSFWILEGFNPPDSLAARLGLRR